MELDDLFDLPEGARYQLEQLRAIRNAAEKIVVLLAVLVVLRLTAMVGRRYGG